RELEGAFDEEGNSVITTGSLVLNTCLRSNQPPCFVFLFPLILQNSIHPTCPAHRNHKSLIDYCDAYCVESTITLQFTTGLPVVFIGNYFKRLKVIHNLHLDKYDLTISTKQWNKQVMALGKPSS
ncbi:hypothetical protein L9F63_023292, partial [Diploptera punctata]